jgi:hypothetical protein
MIGSLLRCALQTCRLTVPRSGGDVSRKAPAAGGRKRNLAPPTQAGYAPSDTEKIDGEAWHTDPAGVGEPRLGLTCAKTTLGL